jgi:hypothetical protein
MTVRDILRLLLEAGSYPRQSNTDWRDADELEAAALARAEGAIGFPDDSPEFRIAVSAATTPSRRAGERFRF